MPVIGFTPARKMTEEECLSYIEGLNEYITADDIYIPYNDAAPDFGAFELDGVPFTDYVIPDPIELKCLTGNSSQEVFVGSAIEDIVYEWNDVAAGAIVENLPAGLNYTTDGNTLTISGTPTESGSFSITAYAPEGSGSKPVSATGIINVVVPSKVLTGDWYLFQDEWDALPTDLQGVLSITDGDGAVSVIDPAYSEDGAQAEGWSIGAINLGKSNGSMTLTLNEGVLKYMLRVFATGDRKFKITYTTKDNETKSVTTDKYKKGAYDFDVLALAGLTTDEQRMNIRSITFGLTGANGGARIYEMYVAVPDLGSTGIQNINTNVNANSQTRKYISNGRIVIVKNGVRYNVQGQKL